MRVKAVFTIVALALGFGVAANASVSGFARDFTYKQTEGAVDVLKGNQVIARYVYKDTPRPYLYPLLSPANVEVTRNYPMKTVAGEPTDHPHHRSLWLGFGDINGVDLWAETEKSGKIVQTSIDFQPIIPGSYWSIHTSNDWVLPDGKRALHDERKITFYSSDYGTFVVTSVKFDACEGKVKFGDTKEGFFAIRVAPGMALKDGKGHILNSAGDKDDKAWGKRARWIDYTGEVNGKVVGVTMFDSLQNYGYPTYWHARDYGLLAANPFGGKAFTGDEKNDSSMTLEKAATKQFVYILLIHDGKLDPKTLDSIADQVGGAAPRPDADPDNPAAPLYKPKPASSSVN